MPVIVTGRAGTCTTCGGRIRRGEFARYTQATGTQHPECAGQPTRRTNEKPGRCAQCGRYLEAGAGRLEADSRRLPDGRTRTAWRVRCLSGCA